MFLSRENTTAAVALHLDAIFRFSFCCVEAGRLCTSSKAALGHKGPTPSVSTSGPVSLLPVRAAGGFLGSSSLQAAAGGQIWPRLW